MKRWRKTRGVLRPEANYIWDGKWGRGQLWNDVVYQFNGGWEPLRNLGWVTRRRNIEYILFELGIALEECVEGIVDGVQGARVTEEIKAEPEEAERLTEALRQAREGRLRSRPWLH